MEKDEIVRQVLAEVERRLSPPAAARRLALVEPGPGLAAVLGRLLQLGDVSVVLCGQAAKAPEAEAWGKLMPVLPDAIDHLEQAVLPGLNELILPNLRPGTAARIALGMDHGTVPYLTQAALFAGVAVTVTPGWQRVGPPAYLKLYDGYLERLREFGAQVAAPGPAEVAPPSAVPAGSTDPDEQAPEEFQGRVLTQGDVTGLLQRKFRAVALPAGTLVTALALDTARSKGLRLIRR